MSHYQINEEKIIKIQAHIRGHQLRASKIFNNVYLKHKIKTLHNLFIQGNNDGFGGKSSTKQLTSKISNNCIVDLKFRLWWS